MEPEEFRAMTDAVRHVEAALGQVTFNLPEKSRSQKDFSRSLFVVRPVKKGEKFTPENIRSIRPGYGLHTRFYDQILGCCASEDIEAGMPMKWAYVEGMENRTDICPAKMK
jgi:sialic acid synthase SpsE